MFEADIFNKLLSRHRENRLSHAFLFETNDLNRCYSDILNFVKFINCPFEFKKDCSREDCNLCSLIDNGNLPNLLKIDPDGTQIKKGQIQEIIEKFQTMPIFSKYNIYIINQCDKLNSSSANSLLKFLEEPEDNIIGFFITNSKMNVISTVRSRCQEYSIYYDKESKDYKYLDNIVEYLNSVYKNDNAILYNKNTALFFFEDRATWIDFFKEMLYLFHSYLKGDKVLEIKMFRDLSNDIIVKIVLLIETILKYLQSNGNIELILDKFVLEMRNIYA